MDYTKIEDEPLVIPPEVDSRTTMFLMASADGHAGLVRSYLKQGVDPSIANQLALALAVKGGNPDCITALLSDRRVDVTARGEDNAE